MRGKKSKIKTWEVSFSQFFFEKQTVVFSVLPSLFFSTELIWSGMFCQKVEPTMSDQRKQQKYFNLTRTLLPLAKCRQLKELVVSLPAQSTFCYLEHDSGCLLQAIKPFFQVCLLKHPKSCDCCCGQILAWFPKEKPLFWKNFFFTKSIGKLLESFPVLTSSLNFGRRISLTVFLPHF